MRLENTFLIFPGIGQKTEKRLWREGIRRWEELVEGLSGKKKTKVENELSKARKNLEVGNTRYFESSLPSSEVWRLYRDFEQNTCFFDIETTGLKPEQSRVTTISFHMDGETETLVRGEDLGKESLQEKFFDSDLLVSFNGKRFDIPFLEKSLDIEVETPHLDLMYPCRKLGLNGGLKPVEKELGIQRELEDIDGREAIRLWKRYEKGDERALEKLIRYNRYDARNLKQLTEEIHNRLDERRFRKHLQ